MLVLDTIAGMILLSIFSDDHFQDGLNPEQINEAILAITQTDAYLMGSLLLGSLTTLFGGYLAARIAKTYPYFNAAAFGLIGVVIGFAMSNEAPFWYNALAYTSTIPAALFGGHLAKKWLATQP